MSPAAVFLDTVGLLALWDEDDQWHGPAEAAYAEVVRGGYPLFITAPILLECANAAARKPFRHDVAEFRDRMEAKGAVFHPSAAEWESAWRSYAIDRPGGPGVVDQLSFLAMRRVGATHAFTNDKHFRAAGFHTLF